MGSHLRLQQVVSIAFMTTLLVMILTMRMQCATGAATLFEASTGGPGDGGSAATRPLR